MMRPAFARRASLHSTHLFDRTLYRRGVEVAIWGMPIVSVDAMRQAFFRDAGANYCDIVYWSKPADAKFQFTTPNASTYYAYFNYNTRQGPLVLEVPAASDGARLTGSLIGAWQAPLADIGFEREDKGQGGRYLLMPPSIARRDPPDYIAVPSDTYNGYALARASAPSEQRFIDMAGTLFDGSVRFDDTFFDSLARMVDEEPIQQRDLVAMGQLHSIGVQKGRPFTPDQATRDVLRRAAHEAHLTFMENAMVGDPFWPDKRWLLPAIVGPKTGFAYETGDRLEIDERGTIFFLAFAAPKSWGPHRSTSAHSATTLVTRFAATGSIDCTCRPAFPRSSPGRQRSTTPRRRASSVTHPASGSTRSIQRFNGTRTDRWRSLSEVTRIRLLPTTYRGLDDDDPASGGVRSSDTTGPEVARKASQGTMRNNTEAI